MNQIDEAVIAQGSALDDILREWGLGRLELNGVEVGQNSVMFQVSGCQLLIDYENADFGITASDDAIQDTTPAINRLVTLAYRMGFLVDWEEANDNGIAQTWPLYFAGYHLYECESKRTELYDRRMKAGLNWTAYVGDL